MAVIFALSSRPDLAPQDDTPLHVGVYKFAHVLVFGALGFLVSRALRASAVDRAPWWTMVIVILYALSDETHQSFVPGRSPSLLDVGVDAIGGILGLSVARGRWIERAFNLARYRIWRANR